MPLKHGPDISLGFAGLRKHDMNFKEEWKKGKETETLKGHASDYRAPAYEVGQISAQAKCNKTVFNIILWLSRI